MPPDSSGLAGSFGWMPRSMKAKPLPSVRSRVTAVNPAVASGDSSVAVQVRSADLDDLARTGEGRTGQEHRRDQGKARRDLQEMRGDSGRTSQHWFASPTAAPKWHGHYDKTRGTSRTFIAARDRRDRGGTPRLRWHGLRRTGAVAVDGGSLMIRRITGIILGVLAFLLVYWLTGLGTPLIPIWRWRCSSAWSLRSCGHGSSGCTRSGAFGRTGRTRSTRRSRSSSRSSRTTRHPPDPGSTRADRHQRLVIARPTS